MHHALGDAVLKVRALLAAQPAQPLGLEVGRVGADGAEELGVPEPALVARRSRWGLGVIWQIKYVQQLQDVWENTLYDG